MLAIALIAYFANPNATLDDSGKVRDPNAQKCPLKVLRYFSKLVCFVGDDTSRVEFSNLGKQITSFNSR